jgi:hypothetical protein
VTLNPSFYNCFLAMSIILKLLCNVRLDWESFVSLGDFAGIYIQLVTVVGNIVHHAAQSMIMFSLIYFVKSVILIAKIIQFILFFT